MIMVYFIASSAVSSAYLTLSELFTIETRAMTIGLFYSIGIAIDGVATPAIFGILIETDSRRAYVAG